ncbi:MAG: hypothetical protein HZB99_04430 [Candidatus Harrisonbacteria bacterium]|nr:hypothetical protein [Candidatus Harrisonbacteria bacterium]
MRKWRQRRLRILSIVRRLQIERGNITEGKTFRACQSLKEKGYVADAGRSKHNDFNDRVRKWDILIILPNRSKIWFQVKSSDTGVRQHLEKYGNSVPVIKIEPHYSIEEIERIVIEKFSLVAPDRSTTDSN